MTEKSSKYLILNLAEESDKLNYLEENFNLTPITHPFSDLGAWNSNPSFSPTKSPFSPLDKTLHQSRRKYTDPIYTESPLKSKSRQVKALSSLSRHQKLPALTPKMLTPKFSNNPNQFNHNFQSKKSLFCEEFWNSEKNEGFTKESLRNIGFNRDFYRKQVKYGQIKGTNKSLDLEYEAVRRIKPRNFNSVLVFE